MHYQRLCHSLILNYRVLPFRNGVLPFYWLAFILSLLPIQDLEAVSQSEAIRFVKRFCAPWPSRKWDRYDWFPSPGTNLMQYHFRMISPSEDEHQPSHHSLEGVQFHRSQGSLPSLGGETITPFVESRISIGLHTTLTLELPIFVLVTVGDLAKVSYLGEQDGEQDRDKWSQANLLPCLEYTGVVAFQFAIYQMATLGAKEWTDLLDSIDKALTAEVNSC